MPTLRVPFGILLLPVLALGPVINEVLYDPPGSDGDSEFVELFNPTAAAVSLRGVELWFVNGGDVTDRRRVWAATAATTIGPGAFFLVGERGVPAADATTSLDLQNGPDALWLVRDGATIDAVAWGDEAATAGEGRAAPDVTSRGIGRVPDGRDTDDNAADFRALESPTPGDVNVPELSFVPLGAALDPPWRADAGSVTWSPRWRAVGWAPWQTGVVTFDGETRAVEAAAGDTVVVDVVLGRSVGDHVLVFGSAAGPADTTRLRIGPVDVRLSEIQARPASGEPEWVEIVHRGSVALPLTGWALGDATATHPLGAVGRIEAGERWVLTADPERWRAVYGHDVVVIRPEGGWAALNDGSPGSPEPADVVRLFDADGRLVDRAAYRRDDLGERGESLQRTDVVVDGQVQWMRAAGPPTPGRAHPSEDFAVGPGVLTVGPDPFSPDGDAVEDLLQIVLEDPGDGARVVVFDLFGESVRELVGAVGPRRGHWQWDGTDAHGRAVPVGAYVVHVRRGGGGSVWRRVVGLGRR